MNVYNNKSARKTPQSNLAWSHFKSNFLSVILVIIAYSFIKLSYKHDFFWQDLFLGLGTGAATSALVSYVFYFNDKQAKKREQLVNRIKFMEDFRALYYNTLFLIDFDTRTDTKIGLETYIKNQHRWFHDYYKRMVAGSEVAAETLLRVKQLEQFMIDISTRIPLCFEYNTAWKNSDFTEWQNSELNRFYIGVKTTETYLTQHNYGKAFNEFAYVLETFKRMPSTFVELHNFNLIEFSYDYNADLTVELEKFECKEPLFKYAREFQEIRYHNYKTYFAEKSQNRENINSSENS